MDKPFVRSPAGYIELMKSSAMQAACHEGAASIMAGAQSSLREDRAPQYNEPYYLYDDMGRDRCVSRVITGNPHSMRAELKYGPLQNAAGV